MKSLQILICFFPQIIFASTLEKKLPWISERLDLKASLDFDVEDHTTYLSPPESKLSQRIKFYRQQPTIDPVVITLKKDDDYLWEKAMRLAKTGHERLLYKFFKNSFDELPGVPKNSTKRFAVNPSTLDLIDLYALSQLYSYVHHEVKILSSSFKKNPKLKNDLMDQLDLYLSDERKSLIQQKIAQGIDLNLSEDLLSPFASKMVKNFVTYRGPNCFHAALAFQSPVLTRSELFNVAEEKGYHRSMINYDELWRVIKSNFYEVNPRQTPLKFGDMIVFFNLPGANYQDEPSFRWIRHTTTYLVNQYTFSKGSKSANTPYVIKTLSEEWDSWVRNTTHLAVKVFRKGLKNVTKRPPKDLEEWLY